MELRNPSTLTPHPLNAALYHEQEDEDFLASVREHGVLEALVILPDDTIVSGHRRWQTALTVGLDEVPVVVRHDLTDDLTIEQLLIHSNKQREKTKEERAREFTNLLRIETALAKGRMSEGGGDKKSVAAKSGGPNLPQPVVTKRAPKAADLAAEAVGLKRTTATKVAEVVEVIDELEEAGQEEEAEQLREMLNNGSVSNAHRMALPDQGPEVKHKARTYKVNKMVEQVNLTMTGLLHMAATDWPGYPDPDYVAMVTSLEWNPFSNAREMSRIKSHIKILTHLYEALESQTPEEADEEG